MVEAKEVDLKVMIHSQFMVDISGVSVFLILTGIITDQGMVTTMEMARVKEMAQGVVTPTMQKMKCN